MSGLTVVLRHRFDRSGRSGRSGGAGGFALDVDFDAPPGVTALFGRSGAGKSSVLAAIAGLLRPDHARIVAGGRVLVDTDARTSVALHRRRVGCVFQDARLFAHMTVRQNLRYGMARGRSEARIADFLGLTPLLGRRPGALSGGETSRVAIGRALLSDPDILLMDEPLAALDGSRKAEILPYLARLRDETRIPILYVSHALDEVGQLANRLVVIEAGRIAAQGPAADLLADPAMVPHLGPRGVGAVLTGRIVAHHDDGLSEVAVPGGTLFVPRRAQDIGDRLRLRIAAGDVILSRQPPQGLSALNVLVGRITAIGADPDKGAPAAPDAGVSVRIALGGCTGPRDAALLAQVTQRSATALHLAVGQQVHMILKTIAVAPGDIGEAGESYVG